MQKNEVKKKYGKEEVLKDLDFLNTHYLNKINDYLLRDENINIPMNDYIKVESIVQRHSQNIQTKDDKYREKTDFENYNDKNLTVKDFIFESLLYFIEDSAKNLMNIDNLETLNYVSYLSKFITKFKQVMRGMNRILSYNEIFSISNIYLKHGLDTIKSKIFNENNIYRVYDSINDVIEKERYGNIVSRDNICNITYFMECLGFFNPDINMDNKTKEIQIVPLIEKIQVDMTKDKEKLCKTGIRDIIKFWLESQTKRLEEFLKTITTDKIENCNVPEYISFFNKYIEKEMMIIKYYFPLDTQANLKKIVFKKVILEQAEILKNKPSGFENMLIHQKLDELAETYRFFSNYEASLDVFLKEFSKYIKSKGKEIYSDEAIKKEPIKLILKTMELQRGIEKMIEDCFCNHRKYIDTNNKAFNVFMKEGMIYPKFLAIYCDSYMKITVKTKNLNQIDADFNNVIALLRCLNDKHVFKMEYYKLLQERILNNKTGSIEAEKQLISKICNELGNNFVYEFNVIIQDIDNSTQFNESFKLENHKGIISGVNFNCKLLSKNAWNIDKNKDFKLDIQKYSPKIENCMNKFKDFFLSSNKSKLLHYVLGAVSFYFNFLGFSRS